MSNVFADPENHESINEAPETVKCDLCDTNNAEVRVIYSTHKENVCLACMSTPDYQRIIKRDQPKRFLI